MASAERDLFASLCSARPRLEYVSEVVPSRIGCSTAFVPFMPFGETRSGSRPLCMALGPSLPAEPGIFRRGSRLFDSLMIYRPYAIVLSSCDGVLLMSCSAAPSLAGLCAQHRSRRSMNMVVLDLRVAKSDCD